MSINSQKPEPQEKGDGSFLDLHSIFFTIQGEGPFTGERAIFVRLAGCNIQCPGCDTEYTAWRRTVHYSELIHRVQEIVAVNDLTNPLIVITGGEPLRQNLDKFCGALLDENYRFQIETNGILPPSPELGEFLNYSIDAHLVVSPKTSRINAITASLADAFKYVLQDGHIDADDGLPTIALGHKASPKVARPPINFCGTIYVNPMDEKDEERNAKNVLACANSCMDHGHRMGLQLHKIINME